MDCTAATAAVLDEVVEIGSVAVSGEAPHAEITRANTERTMVRFIMTFPRPQGNAPLERFGSWNNAPARKASLFRERIAVSRLERVAKAALKIGLLPHCVRGDYAA